MRRRPPRSTRTDTPFPYTTLSRSAAAPAHWSPERLATTILVEGSIEGFADLMPRDTETLATLDDGDALHLILSCRDIRLRVCITSALERTELAFVIPANSMADRKSTRLNSSH